MSAHIPADVVRLAIDLEVSSNFAFLPHVVVVPGGASVPVTLCNCYASVFVAALGCYLPSKRANEQIAWLQSDEGKLKGWMQVDRETARQRAAGGFPTIAAWANPASNAHSHIAPCVPSPETDPSHIYVSAAGRENFIRARLEESFGVVANMLFFTHD